MSAIQPQAYFQSIRQFKCSNCGGELNIINKRTNYIGCQYCGAVLDAHTEAHRIITKLNAPSNFPPRSFIQLGMTAVFDEKKHQVLGRTRWQSNYKEHWAEEGETGYSDERWEYDEWVLMSEDRTYFYLIEDAEGYTISRSVLPKHPGLPRGNETVNFYSGKREGLAEYGDSEVVYFEGESTYQIRAGDRVKFAQYDSKGYQYLTEWRLTDSGEIKEVEFFREELVSYKTLLKAFSENEPVRKIEQTVVRRASRRGFWRNAYWATALAFFVLLANSCNRGKAVFSQEFSVPVTRAAQETDTAQVLAISQPFTLPTPNRVYQVEFSASIPDNADVWAGVEFLNEKGETINALEGNFYRASGDEAWQEDGESGVEHWEESQTDQAVYYRVDQPGTYTARISTLPTSTANAVVRLNIYEQPAISRYYLFGFLIFALLAVVTTVSASVAKN